MQKVIYSYYKIAEHLRIVEFKANNMNESDKKEILETHKWIKVEKYNDDNTLTWEKRYKRLEAHHLEETNFLISKIREIVKNI